MTRKISYLLIFVLCFSIAGCKVPFLGQKKKKVEKKQPIVNSIDDTNLAKMLLKPERKILRIKKDPFRPIVTKEQKTKTVRGLIKAQTTISNIDFLGVVQIGEKYSALLKTAEGKEVYHEGDKINDFTVVEIQEDHIILKKDDETHKIMRGDREG